MSPNGGKMSDKLSIARVRFMASVFEEDNPNNEEVMDGIKHLRKVCTLAEKYLKYKESKNLIESMPGGKKQ